MVTCIWSWSPSLGPTRQNDPQYGGPYTTLKRFMLKQSVTPFLCKKIDGKFNVDIYLELGPQRLHGPSYGGPLLTWKWFELKQVKEPFKCTVKVKFNQPMNQLID